MQHSERIDFVNSLLKVLWGAWKTADPFKKMILEESYLAANKDRPSFLSEITFESISLVGPAPTLIAAALCPEQVYRSEGLNMEQDFLIEGDAEFKGAVNLQVKLGVKYYVEVPVTLNIEVSAVRTRLRLCYSNNKDSFLQLVGSPKLNAEVQPVLGNQN